MVESVLVQGNNFSHRQFVVDEFDKESAVEEVLPQCLTMGLPVDHVHVGVCPFISVHGIIPNSWCEGFAAYRASVS